MRLSPDTLSSLQANTAHIRNICILAHVDHGKTSLSDSLLATNGIISQRMAGKVRYLDLREDEQLRGITMEALAISLYFKVLRRRQIDEKTPSDVSSSSSTATAISSSGSNPEEQTTTPSNDPSNDLVANEYLINLIDSPGHIDFSSEVSTSARLCDGAVVVVDIIEGVCSQTVNVLRQCWVDRLKPILVLNKFDRLITEWQFTPEEALQHILRTIEQVNSVLGALFAGDRMEDDLVWRESDQTTEFVEKTDDDIYFAPEKNNVVFASAVDGWGFTVNTFAKIYAAKLGVSHKVLTKTLWGDFHLDMKNKKILPGKKAMKNSKTLFVSLVLEPIWSVYDACIVNRDQDRLEKIILKLDVKVLARDLRSKEYKTLLNTVMSQWLPLSHALLGSVIERLPSPIDLQGERMEKLIKESTIGASEVISDSLKQSLLESCSKDPEHNTVAYVSKMISIPVEELPKETTGEGKLTAEQLMEKSKKARELAKKASEAVAEKEEAKTNSDPFQWEVEEEDFEWENDPLDDDNDVESDQEEDLETLVAFTRVFSGTLSVGQKITVIGPKYDPTLPANDPQNQLHISKDIEITDLFLIMGRELVRIKSVPSGNIAGVVGLGDLPLKNATILSNDTPSILNLSTTSQLIHNKPIMKIAVEPENPAKLEKLERGLARLAQADSVLEWYVDDDSGELIMCVAGELHLERCLKDLDERFAKGCEVVVKEPVIPFREGIIPGGKAAERSDLEQEFTTQVGNVVLNVDVFPLPTAVVKFLSDNEGLLSEAVIGQKTTQLKLELKQQLVSSFGADEDGDEDKFVKKFLLECGFINAERFVDHIVSFGPKRVGANILVEGSGSSVFRRAFENTGSDRFEYENNVLNGFQLATNEGPLASEQLLGVAVVIKEARIDPSEDEVLGGRIITFTRDIIHHKFSLKGPRLFLAMYTCEIQAGSEVLGKVYGVVQKRGGTIISEEMREGTPFFTIVARVPVVEAFGFSEEIRKKLAGAASPQLIFDGFDVLDMDPYWVPHTEEELEELGEFAERENVARKYMNAIRRRKGLFVDEKVVSKAEKQRTLKKD